MDETIKPHATELEKRLTANRWILEGVYDFSPTSAGGDQYCVFKPKRSIAVKFTTNNIVIVYLNGKEYFRARYRCTKRFLIVDGPGMGAWVDPGELHIREKSVLIAGSDGKNIWLMIVNNGEIDRCNMPISMLLIPDVS